MKKTTRKFRKTIKPLRTLDDFANACGVPLTTVAGWTKHDLWQWPKKAPWAREIVPEVLRWAADKLERGRPSKGKTDPGGSDTITRLRQAKLGQEIRKLRANADQAETALAKERGALHDAADCEDETVRRAAMFRNGVQNIPTQVVSLALGAGLPHQSAPAFQKKIEELVNGCLRHTAAAADAISETGDTASAAGASAAGTVDAQ